MGVQYNFCKDIKYSDNLELGLWWLTPFSIIFHLYRGSQVLLVDESGEPGENHLPAASH
jgi:hypothetical protein